MARNNRPDASFSPNQISKGTSFRGDIETEGDIRIDGQVEGTLTSKGKVVIGPTGVIDGEIHCQSASIEGKVTGTVKAKELLSLLQTARLHGDLWAGQLSIQPGAEFNGGSHMGGVIKEINREPAKQADKKERQLAHAE